MITIGDFLMRLKKRASSEMVGMILHYFFELWLWCTTWNPSCKHNGKQCFRNRSRVNDVFFP